MAIESARNSLHADTGGPGLGKGPGSRRRAATAGGHMLLRPHLRRQEWGAGLSPRPASAQGRGSRPGDGEPAEAQDPDEIGRAITSDSGNGFRRRSRSLSGLQDLADAHASGRRRSDEIRYWRESYDPGFMSPLSSNAQEDIDDAGLADGSAPESPAAERPPKTPPQPFDFGLLSKEMAGMKITHAADMDTRLSTLESRHLQLERLVNQLRRTAPSFGEATARPGSSRRSLETDTHSQVSFSEAPTYTVSLHPPSLPPKTSLPPASSAEPPPTRPLNRPTSTATVRGASSLSATPHGAGSGAVGGPQDDAIALLRRELEAERAARHALEAQVKRLSERLNTLSTTMFAMVRGPSESRSQERLASSSPAVVGGGASPSSKTLLAAPTPAPAPSATLPSPLREHHQQQQQQQTSVFETDDEGETEAEAADLAPSKRRRRQRRRRRQQQEGDLLSPPLIRGAADTELEEEEEDEEEGESDFTEDDLQRPACGAFGEVLRVDDDDNDDDDGADSGDEGNDPKRRKAARTLSLSQLTMGRGQRNRI